MQENIKSLKKVICFLISHSGTVFNFQMPFTFPSPGGTLSFFLYFSEGKKKPIIYFSDDIKSNKDPYLLLLQQISSSLGLFRQNRKIINNVKYYKLQSHSQESSATKTL